MIRRKRQLGVPKTVVNERVLIEGALPEVAYLTPVLDAVTDELHERRTGARSLPPSSLRR
jgi:hypothetical protein